MGLMGQRLQATAISEEPTQSLVWKQWGIAGGVLVLYALLMFRLSSLTWGLWYDGISLLTLLMFTEPILPAEWAGMDLSVAETGVSLQALLQRWLNQWISPLFWYVFLGPVALLAYGIITIIVPANAQEIGYRQKLQVFMDWVPGRCMALAVALLTHFMARIEIIEQRFLVFEDSIPMLGTLVQLGIQAELDHGSKPEQKASALQNLMHRVGIFALVVLSLLTIYAL